MTDTIKITLTELDLVIFEMEMLQDELAADALGAYQDKLPVHIRKGMQLRLRLYNNSLAYLEKLIMDELVALPLYHFTINIPVQYDKA